MTENRYIERRDRCRAEHICYRCGAAMDEGDTRLYCPECREKKAAVFRAWYAERKAAGLCIRCGRPARDGMTLCFACAAYRSEYYRERGKEGGS